MTNTEKIRANNAELREAIEMAENLPDAGEGVRYDEAIDPAEPNRQYTETDEPVE